MNEPTVLDGYTPEMIAREIFMKTPGNDDKYRIIPSDEEDDIGYAFEILSVIMMEGVEILCGDLRVLDLDGLTVEFILGLNKWFRCLGFVIGCDTCGVDDKGAYDEYYARVYVNSGIYENLFICKRIDKNYHFMLNGHCLEMNREKERLRDLFMIVVVGDVVYRIWFDFMGDSGY